MTTIIQAIGYVGSFIAGLIACVLLGIYWRGTRPDLDQHNDDYPYGDPPSSWKSGCGRR